MIKINSTEIIAIDHHALRYDPGAKPCLYGARHQSPMRQIDPPFRIVMFVAWLIRSSNVQQ